MKLKCDWRLKGKHYKAGEEVPAKEVFPLFLINMFFFGGGGFLLAYYSPDTPIAFVYFMGGLGIFVYVNFHIAIFGWDAVKWMFINAGLGIFGIYSELRVVLKYFDKNIADFAWYVHVIPFTYYVLFTFLLYQAVLVMFAADQSPVRKKNIESGYIIVSLLIYLWIYLEA